MIRLGKKEKTGKREWRGHKKGGGSSKRKKSRGWSLLPSCGDRLLLTFKTNFSDILHQTKTEVCLVSGAYRAGNQQRPTTISWANTWRQVWHIKSDLMFILDSSIYSFIFVGFNKKKKFACFSCVSQTLLLSGWSRWGHVYMHFQCGHAHMQELTDSIQHNYFLY